MKTLGIVAAVVTAVWAMPSQAASSINVDGGACISVTNAAGCRFSGNITARTAGETQSAYNLYNDSVFTAQPDIVLDYLFDTDNGLPNNATVTGLGRTSGTWSTPGFLVEFIAAKAGNGFTLFKLETAASSGTWVTGVRQGLSHLSFMAGSLVMPPVDPPIDPPVDGSGSVPEPSSWLMLIAGFGLTGLFSRRRNRQVRVSA